MLNCKDKIRFKLDVSKNFIRETKMDLGKMLKFKYTNIQMLLQQVTKTLYWFISLYLTKKDLPIHNVISQLFNEVYDTQQCRCLAMEGYGDGMWTHTHTHTHQTQW